MHKEVEKYLKDKEERGIIIDRTIMETAAFMDEILDIVDCPVVVEELDEGEFK